MRNKYLAQREALGMTQEQLATKLNVAVRTVIRWEKGTAAPPYNPFERLKHDMGDTETMSDSDSDMRVKLTWKTWLPHVDKYQRVYEGKGHYGIWHPFCLWDDLDPMVRRGQLPPLPEALRAHVIFKTDGSWHPMLSVLETAEYKEAIAAVRIIPENTELNRKIAESIKNDI